MFNLGLGCLSGLEDVGEFVGDTEGAVVKNWRAGCFQKVHNSVEFVVVGWQAVTVVCVGQE